MVAQPREPAPEGPVDMQAAQLERWLGAARAGDGAAFEQLVGWHQGLLYQMAFHQHGGRAQDAMDSCQETLLSAWRALDRFEGDAAMFRRWLLRILVNTCRDALRASGRRPGAPPDTPPDRSRLPDHDQSPEDYARQQDLRRLLEDCLACLTDAHREVILLDHLGFRQAEMAEILDVERGTVKSRLSRARQHMRDLLVGHLDPDREPFGPSGRSYGREAPSPGAPGSRGGGRSES